MTPHLPELAVLDGPILAIDTALQRAVVALGGADGTLTDEDAWLAGHRHGEELLPRLADLLARNGFAIGDVRAIVIGTGPGAFTGLRVGIATAKALAHGLGVPIVGISTGTALLAADTDPAGSGERGLLLPAGPSDRVLVFEGEARLLPVGTEAADVPLEQLVAVDLAGRADAAALERGERAMAALGASLIRLGADRLARGDVDDLGQLVPDYVTLPRGVTRERGEVAWSHGPR